MSPAAAITGSAAASAAHGPITASMVTAVVASRRAARVIGRPSVQARSETSDMMVSMAGRFEPKVGGAVPQAADLGLLYPPRVDTAGVCRFQSATVVATRVCRGDTGRAMSQENVEVVQRANFAFNR